MERSQKQLSGVTSSMQYVIMDLEWNNVYSIKSGGFINEVIEIGAVRLDEQLRETGTFSHLIRSQIGKRLRGHVKELTHLTNEDLQTGIPFRQAMAQFRKWIGSGPVTVLTWGDTDIRVLIDNFKLFLELETLPFLTYYADLQKILHAALHLSNAHQTGLSAAAKMLGIEEDGLSLHRALDDSQLSAACMRRIFSPELMQEFTLPCGREFYERLQFKAYVISDIHSPKIDWSQMHCSCDLCGREAQQESEWIFVNHAFRATFFCPACNRFLRRTVRFKQYYDRLDIRGKTIELEPPEEEEQTSPARMEPATT